MYIAKHLFRAVHPQSRMFLWLPLWDRGTAHSPRPKSVVLRWGPPRKGLSPSAFIKGNHLSNTTCLALVFFKSGE